MHIRWLSLAAATFLIVTFSTTSYSSIGLADWSDITPGGSEINNSTDSTTLYTKGGDRIEWLLSWYFYKGHVIGKIRKNEEVNEYFLLNEKSGQLKHFTLEHQWVDFLSENNSIPKIWTRSFNTRWSISIDDIAMALAFGFILLFPIMILLLVVLYRAIFREKFNLRRLNTRIIFAVGTLTIVKILSANYPFSI